MGAITAAVIPCVLVRDLPSTIATRCSHPLYFLRYVALCGLVMRAWIGSSTLKVLPGRCSSSRPSLTDPDTSTVRLDNTPTDGQSQTQTTSAKSCLASRMSLCVADRGKTIKNPLMIGFVNSDARILDQNRNI